MLKHMFFFYYYCWNFLCMKVRCDFFLFERLGRMRENKTFYFFNVLTKTRYFNTGFVFLQCKNTNQYWSKCSKIFAENHRFFWNNFKRIFFFLSNAKVIKLHSYCSSCFLQIPETQAHSYYDAFYYRDWEGKWTYLVLERWRRWWCWPLLLSAFSASVC
jgi:hypothetical protein